MFTNGFNTEGLFTMQAVEKRNELNRYCRLEGMDYQRIMSETSESRSLLNRIRHAVGMAAHMGR